MNDWQGIQRLRDDVSGSFAAELLNSARFDAPHAGARHRLLHSLGLASGAIAISKGAEAASASVAPSTLGSAAGAGAAVGGAGSAAALLGGAVVAVPSSPLAAGAMGGAALGGASATLSSGGAALTTGSAVASANGGLQLAAGGFGAGSASLGMLSAFTGAKGAGAWLTSGVIAKWVGIGLLVGGAGSLGVSELAGTVSEHGSDGGAAAFQAGTSASPTRLGQSSEPEFLNPGVSAETASQAASPDVATTKTTGPEQKARPKRASVRRGAASVRSQKSAMEREPAASGLTQEIALIDRARGALREGDAKLALTELEKHHQFGSTTLKPEAEILRIEALIVQGERPLARRKARAFLSEYPASPHRERVLVLLDDAGG